MEKRERERERGKKKRVCRSIGQCIRGWAGGLVVQSVNQPVSQMDNCVVD